MKSPRPYRSTQTGGPASLEQLHEWYPTLEPELIQKVLDFYHANRDEVDAYVAKERDHFAAKIAGTSGDDRKRRLADLYWVLFNSTEMSFNH